MLYWAKPHCCVFCWRTYIYTALESQILTLICIFITAVSWQFMQSTMLTMQAIEDTTQGGVWGHTMRGFGVPWLVQLFNHPAPHLSTATNTTTHCAEWATCPGGGVCHTRGMSLGQMGWLTRLTWRLRSHSQWMMGSRWCSTELAVKLWTLCTICSVST